MGQNNDTFAELGTWEDGDFETTLSEHTGIGSDAGVPHEIRFVAGVVRLLLRRIAELEAKAKSDDEDIAIFVLKPKPPDSVANAEPEPMVDNGRTKLIGRLWFAAAPVAAAHYVDLPENTNDSGRITYVADSLDLGSLPALIFDPRPMTPQLRWYPRGLNDLNNVEVKPLRGEVTLSDVCATIDALYRQCMVTPISMPQGGSLWSDASKNWVAADAEALVQSHLKAGLVARFPYCNVRHEQTQTAGRTDLEIEQGTPGRPGNFIRYGILELKVLRACLQSF